MSRETVYAYYKSEEFISSGTAEELAEEMGVDRQTIVFYASDSYKRRKGTQISVYPISSGVYEHDEVNHAMIRSLMDEHEYNRKEMAEVLNLGNTAFNTRLRGEVRFKKSEIEEIADLFFVDVEDLLTEKGKEEM